MIGRRAHRHHSGSWSAGVVHLARIVVVVSVLAIGGVCPQSLNAGSSTIVVSNAMELQTALTVANAGRRIHALPGTYSVSAPLLVPDGATLEGEGIMRFDSRGLPTGFQPGTETKIRAASLFAGDLLTLGDGVTVRQLVVEDFLGRPTTTRSSWSRCREALSVPRTVPRRSSPPTSRQEAR